MNLHNNFLRSQAQQDAKYYNCLTAHAAIRAQQRGVDLAVLDCLLRYGRHEHDHTGCEVVTFDDRALEKVARSETQSVWRSATEARLLFAIINSDGSVVTTGHRFRRVRRDKSISSHRPGRSRRPRILNANFNRYRFS